MDRVERLAKQVETLAGALVKLAGIVKQEMSTPEYIRDEATSVEAQAEAVQESVESGAGASESGGDSGGSGDTGSDGNSG